MKINVYIYQNSKADLLRFYECPTPFSKAKYNILFFFKPGFVLVKLYFVEAYIYDFILITLWFFFRIVQLYTHFATIFLSNLDFFLS